MAGALRALRRPATPAVPAVLAFAHRGAAGVDADPLPPAARGRNVQPPPDPGSHGQAKGVSDAVTTVVAARGISRDHERQEGHDERCKLRQGAAAAGRR